MSLDGLLVVDKPVGPTSHDVVARVRSILRERRIGHTGTLDPLASGVLPLVIGRATRLAQFLNTGAKRYEAAIRLGVATDTYDALGRLTTTPYAGVMPARERIDEALRAFRGTFLQQPPAFSAKKIDGRRSYRLARARQQPADRGPIAAALPDSPPLPAPISVAVTALEILDVENDLVRVAIACSSGFYVRSLAHDLGAALGVGGHLAALRRTEASGRTLAESIPLSLIEDTEGEKRARGALIPLADVLRELPPLTLTADGVRRAVSGCDLGVRDFSDQPPAGGPMPLPARVRLLDESGSLVGIADLTVAGLLHPAVILM